MMGTQDAQASDQESFLTGTVQVKTRQESSATQKWTVVHFGRVRSSPVSSADETWLRFPIPVRKTRRRLARGHKTKIPQRDSGEF